MIARMRIALSDPLFTYDGLGEIVLSEGEGTLNQILVDIDQIEDIKIYGGDGLGFDDFQHSVG